MLDINEFLEEAYNEEMAEAVERLLPKNIGYYEKHIEELIEVLEYFIENPHKKTSNEDVGKLYRFVKNYQEGK